MERKDGSQDGHHGNGHDGREKGPEIQEAGSFQKDTLDEFQPVSHGVEQREALKDFRHAGDGRGEAGEHDHGHQQQEGSHNGLLEGLSKGGDAQPDGRRRDDEEQKGGGEQPDGALEGDAEPEHGYQHYEDGLYDSGDDGGCPFTEQDFSGGVRGDEKLVEGAFLPFAGDGERSGEDGVDEHEHGNEAGNDEPAGDEVGVEPCAGFYFHRGGSAVLGEQIRPVGGGDLLAVAEGDGRRVRVAPVRNELEGGGPPRLNVAGEVRGDGEPHDDFPVVDHAVNILFRGRRGLPLEDARAFQVRDVLRGRFSAVLVQHGVRHAGDVHGGGIAEDGYLDDGRDDEGQPAFFVPEHGQQFFSDEGGYSDEKVHGVIRGIWGLSAGRCP